MRMTFERFKELRYDEQLKILDLVAGRLPRDARVIEVMTGLREAYCLVRLEPSGHVAGEYVTYLISYRSEWESEFVLMSRLVSFENGHYGFRTLTEAAADLELRASVIARGGG